MEAVNPRGLCCKHNRGSSDQTAQWRLEPGVACGPRPFSAQRGVVSGVGPGVLDIGHPRWFERGGGDPRLPSPCPCAQRAQGCEAVARRRPQTVGGGRIPSASGCNDYKESPPNAKCPARELRQRTRLGLFFGDGLAMHAHMRSSNARVATFDSPRLHHSSKMRLPSSGAFFMPSEQA